MNNTYVSVVLAVKHLETPLIFPYVYNKTSIDDLLQEKEKDISKKEKKKLKKKIMKKKYKVNELTNWIFVNNKMI